MQDREYKFIKDLREQTNLPFHDCVKYMEQSGCDLPKALRLAAGLPMELTESELEAAEWERLENLPQTSKVSTDYHMNEICCPHCGQDFYCGDFGAYG